MTRPPNNQVVQGDEAEEAKPRTVVRYRGANLEDSRSHIRVVLIGTPPRGLLGALRHVGSFEKTRQSHIWRRRSSPSAIFEAQAILNEFFGEEIS